MLQVPFFKQDTDYSCGPASLQMALAFYGKRVSEEHLTKKLHTKKKVGTAHAPLIETATEEGLYVYANNDSTLEEIQQYIEGGIPVIIHFIEPSGDDGHYAVVRAITKNRIVLNDPWNGENFSMKHGDFLQRWTSEDKKHHRWMMAVSDKKFSLGKQYLPSHNP